MPSKQQDAVKSRISPVLFMTIDGEPMSFFLRPGPVKRRLQPLIAAGGGLLCNVQQPGAILLIDPEERDSVTETNAHRYVSTHYIDDCIKKEEQLNIEDYKLNPVVYPRVSARLRNIKVCTSGISGGRLAYSPEDDAAILSYVSKRITEVGGNQLWQEMENQHVTSHSWHSMKYRYRVRLAKKSEAEEESTSEEDGKAREEETKDEENQETGIAKSFTEEDTVPHLPPHLPEVDPLQVTSAETNLTQICAQPIVAESVTENGEAQMLTSPNNEVQNGNPQTEDHIAESTQVESIDAELSYSSQPEGPCLDSESDVPPISNESTETQSLISPQNESNENSLQSLTDTTSPIKRKVKQKASPKLEQPRRRVTRRQLNLEVSSPEPYGKKLRSSSYSAEKPFLQTVTRKKSSVKCAHKNGTTVDQPLSKRSRGESVSAMTASQQGESEEDIVSETPQTDEELPQTGEKKKQKQNLGVLELATKEFEDENESGEDEASDLQNADETVTVQPTSTEPCLPPSDTAADASPTCLNPDPGPSLGENVQDGEWASSSNHVSKTCFPNPTATEAVPLTSRAHLFIFDNESQEVESQSLIGENTAVAAQAVVNNAALSLTQAQLEEDMQRITDLMNQTNQDLVSVTKALLKTSGDFSAALNLLSNPASLSGPIWNHYDDELLLSADPNARQQLQEKYGEEDLAKRAVFLEVEG